MQYVLVFKSMLSKEFQSSTTPFAFDLLTIKSLCKLKNSHCWYVNYVVHDLYEVQGESQIFYVLSLGTAVNEWCYIPDSYLWKIRVNIGIKMAAQWKLYIYFHQRLDILFADKLCFVQMLLPHGNSSSKSLLVAQTAATFTFLNGSV